MEQAMQIEREIAEIKAKQAAAEEQHKTLFNRLEQAENMVNSVHELALSVRDLTNTQANMQKQVTGLCADVDAIKAKPGKRWEGVVEKVIYTVIGAMISYVLMRMGIS